MVADIPEDAEVDEQRETETQPPAEELRSIQAALRQVRRETFKAGLVYALVDAAVVAVVVTGGLSAFDVAAVPEIVRIPVPGALSGVLETLLGTPEGEIAISGAALVGLTLALVNIVAEMVYVRRKDPVEWFERANPDVAEALRTARDTSADVSEDVMARRLYDDVLARLREASGARLLDRQRLAIPIILLVLLSIGATQTAVIGFTIELPDLSPGNPPPDQAPGQNGGGPTTGENPGGLAPGEDVLGEATDPPRGVDPDDVVVDPGGGGSDVDRPYETGGFPSEESEVEAEVAGFAPAEQLEDADLIQEYLLAIRQNATGGGGGG